ncbi:MAG TPA: UDP-glucose--hexose-1-phosphate uridylyltransferase [Bacteroidota bacterium]|nr:UDP-glucose--hexose-1-phosphate uridylyltransferase [Bacteroidota bacterium]
MTNDQHPHRRRNALTGEWVLVSPQRTQRPWQGKRETLPHTDLPEYDPQCYLCPGNTRTGGETNPRYTSTFVFTNDFPALLPDGTIHPRSGPETRPIQTTGPEDLAASADSAASASPSASGSQFASTSPLFQHERVSGTSRVICYSPHHNRTLADLSLEEVLMVVDAWAAETAMLGTKYRWVQVFENKGEMMGCSNPHPHGQIWTGSSLPNEPYKEHCAQQAYLSANRSILLEDYAAGEDARAERIVAENDHWVALVPYWAVWPFELLLLPRTHVLRVPDLDQAQRTALAQILKMTLTGYDALFSVPFPYSLGWHGAPYMMEQIDHWQLHAHIYPPLLRSASVKKFLVGYEMLAEPQRDLTPESAAELLRKVISLSPDRSA